MLRPFIPELVMSTDLLSFEHPCTFILLLENTEINWTNKHIQMYIYVDLQVEMVMCSVVIVLLPYIAKF